MILRKRKLFSRIRYIFKIKTKIHILQTKGFRTFLNSTTKKFLFPELPYKQDRPLTSSACPGRSMLSFPVLTSHTLSVLSLLPLTSSRLSADHATSYTEPTWPRRDIRYLTGDKSCPDVSLADSATEWFTAVLLTSRCDRPRF